VLENFERRAAAFQPDDASTGDQLQAAFIVQLSRPVDVQLDLTTWEKGLFGREEYTGTGNVHGLSVGFDFAILLIQDSVVDLLLNCHSLGSPPVGLPVYTGIGQGHRVLRMPAPEPGGNRIEGSNPLVPR
jgi:hypothetical protein